MFLSLFRTLLPFDLLIAILLEIGQVAEDNLMQTTTEKQKKGENSFVHGEGEKGGRGREEWCWRGRVIAFLSISVDCATE